MSQPAFRTNRTEAPRPFPNKYASNCERCHGRVEAGQGLTTKEDGQWVVRHQGDCLQQTLPVEPPVSSIPQSAFPVPEGRYTVSFADGSYKTIKVGRQHEDSEFMPGRLILSYLSGSDNDSDYTSFAHVLENGTVVVWKKHRENETLRESVKVLLGSPQAAALAYAEQSGCCARCGRTLTVPVSLNMGYGPECAKRLGVS